MEKVCQIILTAIVCGSMLVGCREQQNSPGTNPNATTQQTIETTAAKPESSNTVPTISFNAEETATVTEETIETVRNENTALLETEPKTHETQASTESQSKTETTEQTEPTEQTETIETQGKPDNTYTLPSFDD